MSPLFESIKVVDGIARHLDRHNARVARSRRELFGDLPPLDLTVIVPPLIRTSTGLCKCRIVYDREIHSVECTPYQQRDITGLVLVQDDRIVYDHKYLDRRALDVFSGIGPTEEAMIVRRGLVTDTRFSNIVFLGEQTGVTPTSPLLRGIQREYLLSTGAIREADVSVDDIVRFRSVVLINAMMELESGPAIPVANIRLAKSRP
jgi:4-amino-4-deoxychorismate lyase